MHVSLKYLRAEFNVKFQEHIGLRTYGFRQRYVTNCLMHVDQHIFTVWDSNAMARGLWMHLRADLYMNGGDIMWNIISWAYGIINPITITNKLN